MSLLPLTAGFDEPMGFLAGAFLDAPFFLATWSAPETPGQD
jgi:hypothetical protein